MNNKVQRDDKQSSEHDSAGKYLSFSLGQETYGCPVSSIKDIIEMQECTDVPQTPDYVDGVINLRGSVIPIINTREKFGMERVDYDRETVIVVVELGELQMGLVVDRVQAVFDVADSQIDPAPRTGDTIDTQFISGMGRIDDEIVILLNIKKVLNQPDIETLKQIDK